MQIEDSKCVFKCSHFKRKDREQMRRMRRSNANRGADPDLTDVFTGTPASGQVIILNRAKSEGAST
jgi:hypothetical protein